MIRCALSEVGFTICEGFYSALFLESPYYSLQRSVIFVANDFKRVQAAEQLNIKLRCSLVL